MANSYTATPSVIPGKLTVGGDLDVHGTVLIGPYTSRLRLFCVSDTKADLTFNLQTDEATQDEAGQSSMGFQYGPLPGFCNTIYMKGGGAPLMGYMSFTQDGDATTHVHTGDTTLDNIYTTTIPGGLMGNHGIYRLKGAFTPTVQGASQSNVYVYVGTTQVFTFPVTSADAGKAYRFELIFGNNGASGSQNFGWIVFENGVAVSASQGTMSVNTLLNQTFKVQVQNGAASDSQTWNTYLLEFMRT